MINIELSDSFVATLTDDYRRNFVLQLGWPGLSMVTADTHTRHDPMDASPYLQNLRPDESLDIEDGIFFNLVTAAQNGGVPESNWLRQIVYLVTSGKLTVKQSGNPTPLTAKQILTYTMP